MTKKHTAFSLIELSIVVLIIGILIAGVTQASRLVKESRLKTAQTITQSSPITSIIDLSLWLETTSDSKNIATGTAGSGVYDNAENNSFVTNWKDRSGVQRLDPLTFVAASDDNRPKYIVDGINGLPVIRFDGSDDTLSSNNIISSRYTNDGQQFTIFYVAKIEDTGVLQMLLDHGNGNATQRINVMLNTSSSQIEFNNGYVAGNFTTLTNRAVLVSAVRNATNFITYLNGALDASNAQALAAMVPYTTTTYI